MFLLVKSTKKLILSLGNPVFPMWSIKDCYAFPFALKVVSGVSSCGRASLYG